MQIYNMHKNVHFSNILFYNVFLLFSAYVDNERSQFDALATS
jgi:hypothetical protein